MFSRPKQKNIKNRYRMAESQPTDGRWHQKNSQSYQWCFSATLLQNCVSVFDGGTLHMTGFVPRPHRPRFEGPRRRFGDYVREVRVSKRIGLRACAEAIGLAPGHYSNVEHGRVGPPDEPTLVKLAEVLEVPVGALLARAGRLSATDLQRFWASPLIPSLVMSSTGWTQEEATMFQETVLASLQDPYQR